MMSVCWGGVTAYDCPPTTVQENRWAATQLLVSFTLLLDAQLRTHRLLPWCIGSMVAVTTAVLLIFYLYSSYSDLSHTGRAGLKFDSSLDEPCRFGRGWQSGYGGHFYFWLLVAAILAWALLTLPLSSDRHSQRSVPPGTLPSRYHRPVELARQFWTCGGWSLSSCFPRSPLTCWRN